MAHTNLQKPTPENTLTVCILYGFCEGPGLAGGMRDLLERSGYKITRDPYAADVVIAHSGGCFVVPKDLPARRVLMIGLTHWPGKSIARALIEKVWDDFRLHRGDRNLRAWLYKFSWNLIYFWKVPYNLRMLRARKRGDFWHAKHLTLIRNQEDSFCTRDIVSLPFVRAPKFVELPGQHDDLWLHPERYVGLLQKAD